MKGRTGKKAIALFLAFALVLLYMPIGAQAGTVTVYHETFANGKGAATQSGNASLTTVTDKVFDGNADGKALYVSNRENDYDAADFIIADIGLENGKTYSITIKGYVDADVTIPDGAKAALQTVNSYGYWGDAVLSAGQAFSITGTYTVDTSKDTSLRIQTNAAGKTVPFYIGDISITGEGETAPVENEIFHETFANGKGAATQSGNASLTTVTDKVFDGNADGKALYVSNRANSWDAVDLSFTGLGLENGKKYNITVIGYVNSDEVIPEEAQAVLGTNTTYTWLNNIAFVAGNIFTLSAEFTVDTNANTGLRIQSNDTGATVPFYIGDIVITGEASQTPDENEVYHETFANGKGAATQSGGASLTTVTDKVFDGNADGKALYVGNRANSWDAADISFIDMGLENGEKYNVTVAGYVYSDVVIPDGAVAVLGTNQTYAWLNNTPFVAGNAFTLTAEFTVDTEADTALRIQSNDAGATVPFLIGDIRITGKASNGDDENPPRPPAEPFTTITFEDQTTSGFGGRAGTETLTVTDEENHTADGSYALKVEGRTSTWHGPALHVEKNIDEGTEYKITAWVKLIEPASSQLQLSTQVGDGSGASYLNLAAKTISTTDGWVQYEGTYRYNNMSSEFVTLYVESSNNATASFYIDDISFTSTGSGPIEIEDDLTDISREYQNDFWIGTAISEEDLEGVRFQLLKKHFNSATAGNAMKPDALQRTKGNFTFDAADDLVDAILAEGMKMHGHVLVWHQQSPEWMNTKTEGENTVPLSREEALDNLRTHIQTVMEHFGDKVISWDVVNEAMNDNPQNPTNWKASLRQSPWYQAIGDDYVEQAFLAAREVLDAHPEWDIKLYYNDYNEDNQNKATAIYSMVRELNEKYSAAHPGKLLIDGIGMQAHYTVSTNPANVRLSLEKFISLGVEVSITELDIQAGSNYTLPQNLADAQGYLYAQLFKLFREHADNIPRVTIWGMDDGTSWRAQANPLIFDKNLQAKPAYYGVIDPDTFVEGHQPDTTDANRSTAKFGTPVIDGAAEAVWSSTPTMQINRYQMAWQGATGTAKALWDNENLYVLVQVSDAQLDKTSENAWEQDSIEVFLDENNAKTSFYQEDDGQFRVNYENTTSFNPSVLSEGFESAVMVSGTNYTVELKIPFKAITPQKDMEIGFDVQINDGKDGARQSAATWNDTTGNGYQDTSVYGILTLEKAQGEEPVVTPSPAPTSTPNDDDEDDAVATPAPTAKPTAAPTPVVDETGRISTSAILDTNTGKASAAADSAALTKAFENAEADVSGKKTAQVLIPEIDGAAAYEMTLPADFLAAQDQSRLIAVKTGLGEVTLPSSMLSDSFQGAQNVSLTVIKPELSGLDEHTKNTIGDRPIIGLSLSVDGEPVAWNNQDAPVAVSIPYTPTEQELADPEHITVWYIDGEGNVIEVPSGRYDPETGMVTFTTTHFSSFAVVYVTKTFSDLGNTEWARKAVEVLASKGVMKGMTDTEFAPGERIARADFLYSLIKALGVNTKAEESFDDISADAYYSAEIAVAKKLGITLGTGNNQFRPDDAITRQDMMVLAERALRLLGRTQAQGKVKELERFTDYSLVADYAAKAVATVVEEGLIAGNGEKLNPLGNTTRAEATMFLYRIYNH